MRRMPLLVACLLMFAAPLSGGEPKPLFEDCFDEKPGEGWSWIRENADAWRIEDGGLEIHVEPGNAGTVKNALVRKAPDRSRGKFAIDLTVSNNTKPTQQYEQAGITWYSNGKPVFKLVKELIDGDLYIIPGKVPMASEQVQLRLVVDAESWVAQFRPDGKGEFKTAATGRLPAPADDGVSIQCYNGPADAEHWIRFDDFRISQLPKQPAFVPLFDGKTLDGWHASPGGKWEVKDRLLIGTSPKSERLHGLLLSDKVYGDFTVRLKFRVVQGNSGFYFRSEKVDGAVGVHGFQAEVDTTPATGGLYETGGRAWVKQPDPEVTKKCYKPGEWTDMTVTAEGRNVVVEVNGVKTVELTDDPGRLKGHFALQLHGGQDMEVMFKDIEILEK